MRYRRILFFILPFAYLFPGSSKFSAAKEERHQEMSYHFIKEDQRSWKYFTGSWGGARDMLADKGITISSKYVINAAGNPYGGEHRGIAQASSWGSDINISLGETTPLTGVHIYASCAVRFGTSLSNRKILNKFNVQQVFGSQTVKLVDLFIQQFALDDRLMWKTGRISAGDNFNHSPLFSYFMNNSFDGNPIVPNFNLPFTAYPAATWGFYFEYEPIDSFRFKIAGYNNNEHAQSNRYHGTNFTFSHPEGYLIFSELGYLRKGDLPGNYLIGAAYSTNRKERFISSNNNRGNYELYLQLDQMVYRTNKESGVTPFFTLLYFPEDRNLFPYFFMTGVVAEGIFDARPKDSINFGYAAGFYSEELRKSQAINNLEKQHVEMDLELNYKAEITEFFYIQPNLQYIIWPSGKKSIRNAFVIGVQSALSF